MNTPLETLGKTQRFFEPLRDGKWCYGRRICRGRGHDLRYWLGRLANVKTVQPCGGSDRDVSTQSPAYSRTTSRQKEAGAVRVRHADYPVSTNLIPQQSCRSPADATAPIAA